jgi:hypothetical protein
MNVSKSEAVAALNVIARTDEQMLTLRRYAHMAPFLLVWGLVWVAANTTTDLAPAWSDRAWLLGSGAGLVVSVILGIRIGRRARAQATDSGRRLRTRILIMMGLAICTYFPAMFVVLGPMPARQANAFTSLSWVIGYMFAGSLFGWRLFTIGAVAAAAIVFGYLAVEHHYYLWMAACGGGALIAGAAWLSKI